MFVKNVSQGTAVLESKHQELVEIMKEYQDKNKITYLKNPTVEQVMKHLQECDEIVIKLDSMGLEDEVDATILRIKENQVWVNGILAYAINPTSSETGKTIQNTIHVSNNYTGQQVFRSILQKYLN